MSYTIKIIDNDNGMVIIDATDAKAIIGSVVLPIGTQGIFSTSCSAEEIAMGIFGAQKSIDIGKKSNPFVGAMVAYAEENEEKMNATIIDLSPLKRKKNGG